jgi:tetratricopeptide (TPR) repeat protein
MPPSNKQRVSKEPPRVPEKFLEQLREDIVSRRLDHGFHCLDAHREVFEACSPGVKSAAALLGYLAQWVDMGYARPDFIKKILKRFSGLSRDQLPLIEYLQLQMAEGLVAMSEEEFAAAVRRFQNVLALQDEIQDKQMVSIAHFWMGRCLRRQGRYDDSLGYVAKAREMALQLGYLKMVAVMRVLEAWIAFQEGHPDNAARLLGEAESVLMETDDYVTRGNISSAYGRISRRQGNYDQALARFGQAIEEYKKRDPYNRNLARSYVNIAFVKRLLAVQLREKLDMDAARLRRKKSGEPLVQGTPSKIGGRERLSLLRTEAFEHLVQAREIYDRYDDHRGNGNVSITYGYLYLDEGELQRAAEVGATAYRLGEEKKDSVLKSRARILQSTVECQKFEEQIEEGSSGASSTQRAGEFAREAVGSALNTQNRRLIAKAYLALGLALCLDFSGDFETARKCADDADALLNPASHDYVWKELQELRKKLRGVGSINSTLREWSQGIVGRKTFQEVTEEFAAIVIPKVWRREECKVARVAAKLSISPKKVRRILRSQGLLAGSGGSTR